MTSDEMDDEPLEEFMMNQHIWNFQEKKRRKDEKRNEQDTQNGVQ